MLFEASYTRHLNGACPSEMKFTSEYVRRSVTSSLCYRASNPLIRHAAISPVAGLANFLYICPGVRVLRRSRHSAWVTRARSPCVQFDIQFSPWKLTAAKGGMARESSNAANIAAYQPLANWRSFPRKLLDNESHARPFLFHLWCYYSESFINV